MVALQIEHELQVDVFVGLERLDGHVEQLPFGVDVGEVDKLLGVVVEHGDLVFGTRPGLKLKRAILSM